MTFPKFQHNVSEAIGRKVQPSASGAQTSQTDAFAITCGKRNVVNVRLKTNASLLWTRFIQRTTPSAVDACYHPPPPGEGPHEYFFPVNSQHSPLTTIWHDRLLLLLISELERFQRLTKLCNENSPVNEVRRSWTIHSPVLYCVFTCNFLPVERLWQVNQDSLYNCRNIMLPFCYL